MLSSSRKLGDTLGLPTVAIVGRANVGKSTLLNVLSGTRLAITNERAGTTRDRVTAQAEWRGQTFTLIDTAGLDLGASELEQQISAFAAAAAEAADLVMFVIDIQADITPADLEVARLLRKYAAQVLLVANKADHRTDPGSAANIARLGFGQPFVTSATSGRGTGDLLDAITKRLPRAKPEPRSDTRVALVGQPNVGKSSLVNAIAQRDVVIVSDAPGTTRDATSTVIQHGKKEYVLLDTAGLTRPGKRRNIEYVAALRSIAMIRAADVCLFMLDATKPITNADKRVASYIAEASKPCVLILNKSDLTKSEQRADIEEHVAAHLPLLSWAPRIMLSAKKLKPKLLEQVWDHVDEAVRTYQISLDKAALRTFAKQVLAGQPIALAWGNKSARLKNFEQTGTGPPTFTLTVDEPRAVGKTYLRFVENRLREQFDLFGSPLRISLNRGKLARSR